MFRSNKKDQIRAFLGEGTSFKGLLNFDGTVRIDGRLEGEIKANGNLILGETALIKANISVNSLIAKGKIIGNIVATDRVEIHSQAEIFGNIKTTTLKIEEGATFVGKCEMFTQGEELMASTTGVFPEKKEEEGHKLVLYPSEKNK